MKEDLVIVPAREENFKRMFLNRYWSCVEISEERKDHLRYIACYQTDPVSAITAYAKIESIKPNKAEPHKYDIFFGEPTILDVPIPRGALHSVQSRRYASFQRLRTSRTLDELFA